MGAYELADELSKFMTEDEYTELDKTIFKAVTMIRHQADYIAQLEKGLESSIELNKAQAERQVKELTDGDRLKVIGTLKWAEDLLREDGHDEAVNEVQDCLMILRKAQE